MRRSSSLMREAAIGGLPATQTSSRLCHSSNTTDAMCLCSSMSRAALSARCSEATASQKGLNASLAIDICVQVCRALTMPTPSDHEQTQLKIIHRDPKRFNLMLRARGRQDHDGIARAAASWAPMTSAGVVRGTPPI